MNDSQLIYLLEQLVALYDSDRIVAGNDAFTPEFTSLIGAARDALSNIE